LRHCWLGQLGMNRLRHAGFPLIYTLTICGAAFVFNDKTALSQLGLA
jgi:hypothetical protein